MRKLAMSLKHLKKMLRDIVGNSGNLDSDAVTEALLCHANTKCRVLNKSPAELAYGRCLKDFFPRSVKSLLPIPANLLSGEVKDKLQEKIRSEGGQRWSEHTRVLPELKIGDFVQIQNLKGRNPLKSDYNGEIVGRHNVNSYAVKVNGTGKTTVRNRASLRKILPPIPVHKPITVQAPFQSSGPSAEPAESRQRAVLPGSVKRAGLRSGNEPSHNIIVSGNNAGSGSQAEADACKLVMHVAANMDNPGIMGILRKSPRPESGDVSAPGQGAAELGRSRGQAVPGHSASAGQGSGGAGSAGSIDSPGHRTLGGQDRLELRQSTVSGNTLAQVDGSQGEPSPHLGQTIEVGLPIVRRGNRQRSQLSPYQAGSSGMEGQSDRFK